MGIKEVLRVRLPKLYNYLQLKKCEVNYKKRKAQDPENYPKLLEKRYKEIVGEEMSMTHPVTYSQKIQWLKLYDPNPLRSQLTDKVAVRSWVKEKIGDEFLIPVYGVYEKFDDIDFDSLPESFVMKTNHSSGWNIVVKDKRKLNKRKARKQMNKWLSMKYGFWTEYEPHYNSIKPKILIEKYMEDASGNLTDYKFLCFDGKAEYVWVDFDRFSNHKRNVYNMKWELQPWSQFTYENYRGGGVQLPPNFELMHRIANNLSDGFIHVRVDLYNVDGKIYFGEMTFTNGSGFEQLYPKEYEKKIGDLIKLPIDCDSASL